MIIAHLPAGYLLTKVLSRNFDPARRTSLWLCGLAASLLPDIDILWFYLEGGVRNHHYYPTHWPLLWLLLFTAAAIVPPLVEGYRNGRRGQGPGRVSPSQAPGPWEGLMAYPLIILANVLLHLLLDCLSSPVFYAAPLSWERIQLIRVPAVYDWWVWNFIRHWTFQLELMVWCAAALVFGLSRWEGRSGRAANSVERRF